MKKGFTLVEMLGVVAIIAVVLLIAFPNINKSLKQIKINKNNNFTNNLKVSAEKNIELNRDKYPELNNIGGNVTIKVQELYDANLLKGKNETINQNSIITIETGEDNILKYYFEGKQIGIE